MLRRSVEYALANPEASLPFVREHAQEMSEEVMYRHIDLYVNDYSVDLGPRAGAPSSCSSSGPRRAASSRR